MSDFLDRLIAFVTDNAVSEQHDTLYFEYSNSKISYFNAWEIVTELKGYKEAVERFIEEADELKDFVRLLRKENQELKENKNYV